MVEMQTGTRDDAAETLNTPPQLHENMELRDIWITLHGVSPILMSNPAHMARSDGGMTAAKKKIISAEDEAERSTYRNDRGELVMPAIAVRRSIIDAGTKFKMQGQRLGTMRGPIVAALHMVEEQFPLLDADGQPMSHYEIDSRRAVIGESGVIRSRARIPLPWVLLCHFWLDTMILQPNDLKNVISSAGVMNGIGDYRPQKMGWFGRFAVSEIRVR